MLDLPSGKRKFGTMWRRWVLPVSAALLLVAWLHALALSVAPEVHSSLHPDSEHGCLVTLIAAGGLDASASAEIATAEASWQPQIAYTVHRTCFVETIFHQAALLEHAPPGLS